MKTQNPLSRFYKGPSMKGTFLPGDYLIVEPVNIQYIHPGDVVIFRTENQLFEQEVVHRVIAARVDGLITRGDNNFLNDEEPVNEKNFLGRVTHFEHRWKIHKVQNGRLGLLRAKVLHSRLRAIRFFRWILNKPYRLLKNSGLVRLFWQPKISRMDFNTCMGPLVKFIHGPKTIAFWWQEEDRFECSKPYDLILSKPHYLETNTDDPHSV